MSDTTAALKDINQAIRLKPTAELYVNRGVIHQVKFHYYQKPRFQLFQLEILANT